MRTALDDGSGLSRPPPRPPPRVDAHGSEARQRPAAGRQSATRSSSACTEQLFETGRGLRALLRGEASTAKRGELRKELDREAAQVTARSSWKALGKDYADLERAHGACSATGSSTASPASPRAISASRWPKSEARGLRLSAAERPGCPSLHARRQAEALPERAEKQLAKPWRSSAIDGGRSDWRLSRARHRRGGPCPSAWSG